jgi:predicted 3-demethylubiquinone-9 3-methyltransferase (glyoxalase superfamily)
MPIAQKISPFLWFDSEAEQAAQFYTGIFKNSRIVSVSRYPKAGFETHHMPEGTPMTVLFELEGQQFSALNGGPAFKFNEAISLMVSCNDQKEIDYYWEKLGAGGDPKAQQCGWLKDRFGLSWQVVPTGMDDMLKDSESPRAERVMKAFLAMKKIDIKALERAAAVA